MPELPEVEHITRGLRRLVSGKTIARVDLLFPGVLKNAAPVSLQHALGGNKVTGFQRRGKYIFFGFKEHYLEVHLRMTGAFLFYPQPVEPGPHTRATFAFQEEGFLLFEDIRKFGSFRLWEKGEVDKSPAFSLGPDFLGETFSFFCFDEILEKRPRSQLKSFLLNQQNIAGLGNIYVDEALHEAKIHPGRKIGTLGQAERKKLFQTIVSMLERSIHCGGTSFSDYRDLLGEKGYFQEQLKVYKKASEPCCHCGLPLRRIISAGRGTYLCPACQKTGEPCQDTR